MEGDENIIFNLILPVGKRILNCEYKKVEKVGLNICDSHAKWKKHNYILNNFWWDTDNMWKGLRRCARGNDGSAKKQRYRKLVNRKIWDDERKSLISYFLIIYYYFINNFSLWQAIWFCWFYKHKRPGREIVESTLLKIVILLQ